ncbi:hypothetical protein [Actimicrobium antarcticum]|uniref:hypothetical protein n=1 Tax=Actimicrobium antarcticum TaxID=1051899 RepID=UPI0031D42A2E
MAIAKLVNAWIFPVWCARWALCAGSARIVVMVASVAGPAARFSDASIERLAYGTVNALEMIVRSHLGLQRCLSTDTKSGFSAILRLQSAHQRTDSIKKIRQSAAVNTLTGKNDCGVFKHWINFPGD